MAKGNYFSSLDKKKNEAMQNISSCSSILIDANLIDESNKNFIFSMNQEKLKGLSDYMNEIGVHEPITCFQKSDGRYEIISGHRRFRARLLKGDTKIDVIVTPPPKTEGDRVYQLIFDNIHSRSLGPMDLARALKEMKLTWLPEKRENGLVSGDTKDILAKEFNISSAKVSRHLRLLNLIPELQDKVENEKLSVDAALLLTLEENNIEGLQEFINETIEKKESNDDFNSLTKIEIVKAIKVFKSSISTENESLSNEAKIAQPSTTKAKISRKKFTKSIETFQNIITGFNNRSFKLNADDIKQLESLNQDLFSLIEQYKTLK